MYTMCFSILKNNMISLSSFLKICMYLCLCINNLAYTKYIFLHIKHLWFIFMVKLLDI